jgi:hypothetical protein
MLTGTTLIITAGASAGGSVGASVVGSVGVSVDGSVGGSVVDGSVCEDNTDSGCVGSGVLLLGSALSVQAVKENNARISARTTDIVALIFRLPLS